MPPLLQVTDLETHYVSFGGARLIKAVDRVSFTLEEGETLGIVGESGCGKTTTCLSIVGLLPGSARIVGGHIDFAGQDLAQLSQREMRRVRGAQIAMILQDPMASLNPLFSIYRQVAEPAYYHRAIRGSSLRRRVRGMLRPVRIPPAQMPEPEARQQGDAPRHPRHPPRPRHAAPRLALSSAVPGGCPALRQRRTAGGTNPRRVGGTMLAPRAANQPIHKGRSCRRRCWKLTA